MHDDRLGIASCVSPSMSDADASKIACYGSNQPLICAWWAAGLAVSGAVDSDGRAYLWGFNENSQLGKVRMCWLPNVCVTWLTTARWFSRRVNVNNASGS